MRRITQRLLILGAAAIMVGLVSGACGGSAPDGAKTAREQQALAGYRSYLSEHASAFTSAIEALLGPIRTQKVPRSQSLYVITRVPYGAIALVAESFPSLDSKIAAGSRRIERRLWLNGTTNTLKAVTKGLRASSEALQRKIKAAPLEPKQIGIDLEHSLHQVSAVKIAGKEQRYADADLVGVAASVEGVEAGFVALKPLLSEEGQALRGIEATFRKLFTALEEYGMLAREPRQYRAKAAGAVFTEYSGLSQAEVGRLAGMIEALATELSGALAPLVQGKS